MAAGLKASGCPARPDTGKGPARYAGSSRPPPTSASRRSRFTRSAPTTGTARRRSRVHPPPLPHPPAHRAAAISPRTGSPLRHRPPRPSDPVLRSQIEATERDDQSQPDAAPFTRRRRLFLARCDPARGRTCGGHRSRGIRAAHTLVDHGARCRRSISSSAPAPSARLSDFLLWECAYAELLFLQQALARVQGPGSRSRTRGFPFP